MSVLSIWFGIQWASPLIVRQAETENNSAPLALKGVTYNLQPVDASNRRCEARKSIDSAIPSTIAFCI